MSKKHFVWFSLTLIAINQISHAGPFPKDSEVLLIQDQILLFNKDTFREAKKGEHFRVLQHRPSEKKVYLLEKNPEGRTIAVNVPEHALAIVPKDYDVIALEGFNNLKGGNLQKGKELLLEAANNLPIEDLNTSIYREAAEQASAIETGIKQIEIAEKKESQGQKDIERRRRNASVIARTSTLDDNNYSKQRKIELLNAEINRLEQELKEAVTEAKQNLLSQVKLVNELAKKEIAAKRYGIGLDLIAFGQTIASKYQGTTAYSPFIDTSRIDGREEIANAAINAMQAIGAARQAFHSKRLFVADETIGQALKYEPGNILAAKLHIAIESQLDEVRRSLATATQLKENRQYEEAIVELKKAQAICSDNGDVNALEHDISTIIKEKEGQLEKAELLEKSGDYENALAIYEKYNINNSIKRLSGLYAKVQEEGNNILRANELYIKAEMHDDVKRTASLMKAQVSEYDQAAIEIAKGEFDKAILIYKKYNDQLAWRAAYRIKARALEESEAWNEAKDAFTEAGDLSEITRIDTFQKDCEKWVINGKNQEAARNFDKALEFYTKAHSSENIRRVAEIMAKEFESNKDYESSVAYYEIAGKFDEAGRIRSKHNLTEASSRRKLGSQEIFKRCAPACVQILTESGSGSGFFVAKGGYIITNNHVVEGAKAIKVSLNDGKAYPGQVIAKSDVPDIALIQIEIKNHPFLKLGDSSTVESGQRIYTLGAPKGLSKSINEGLISFNDRVYEGNPVFQISALINHGSSGGPLIDEMGCVIGINSFGLGTAARVRGISLGSDVQGINYAIKINAARSMIDTHITK